jgi:hypothetical protein
LANVHINQFQPGGSVVDAAALAQFQEQWATYRKLVESDCLAHRAVSGILRETLNDVFTSPFCFLDIACGDANTMKAALRGTQVRHYHGIDLSQAALELAAANLAELPFEVDLDHRDFLEAMMRRPEHADATWCSQSLYEPTRRVDEDRAAYLDRFMRTNKPLWRVLTPAEWDQIWHHVTTCDFPETAAVWCELGREAGFGEARQVFVDPTRTSSGSSTLRDERSQFAAAFVAICARRAGGIPCRDHPLFYEPAAANLLQPAPA